MNSSKLLITPSSTRRSSGRQVRSSLLQAASTPRWWRAVSRTLRIDPSSELASVAVLGAVFLITFVV